MFDFAWSELAVIGIVALLVIGPKDLPGAIKAVGDFVRKARRMAGEFQTHVDDMVKDANLQDVRNQINEIRNFDLKGAIEKEIDGDGALRKTFTENPLDPASYATPAPSLVPEVAAAPLAPAAAPAPDPEPGAPAFIPPAIANAPAVPDFLPPGTPRP